MVVSIARCCPAQPRGGKEVTSQVQEKLPEQLQDALNKGLLKRLPQTFLPSIRQRLRDWDYLFTYEQQSTLHLLLFLASLTPEQSADLFREVTQLEEKMGVRSWQFSTDEQTVLNASLLARSPYYHEWRMAVQRVFDAAEQQAVKERADGIARHRLILLLIPQSLPLNRATIWSRWPSAGRRVAFRLAADSSARSHAEVLLGGEAETGSALMEAVFRRSGATFADAWILDAGNNLVDHVLSQEPFGASAGVATLLSYKRLDTFRENFSHEVNTIQKDLADADAVFARMRRADVTPWCPAEVATAPVIREFLRSLYLSGNGALIYGNSFVEWGASEAFRRARPSFLVAQFGVRSKPKPFTSVVVFENPDQINPLPAVDDVSGSALDAQVLALYVWLAASRYDEYQSNTACLCLAESLSEAYVVAPPEFGPLPETEPVTLERLRTVLAQWLLE